MPIATLRGHSNAIAGKSRHPMFSRKASEISTPPLSPELLSIAKSPSPRAFSKRRPLGPRRRSLDIRNVVRHFLRVFRSTARMFQETQPDNEIPLIRDFFKVLDRGVVRALKDALVRHFPTEVKVLTTYNGDRVPDIFGVRWYQIRTIKEWWWDNMKELMDALQPLPSSKSRGRSRRVLASHS